MRAISSDAIRLLRVDDDPGFAETIATSLERQDDRLEEFTRLASYDLRTPLNVAWRRSELAGGGCDSTYLDAVTRVHDRMDAPTDDLPTLARSENQVSDANPVDLAAPVEDSRRDVETVDGTVRTGIDRVIEADHGRLGQLLETPFHDAVEHGGETVTAVASGSSPV